MFPVRMNRMPKSIVFMLFGFLVLVAALWPQDASARRHAYWSAGMQIDYGDYDYLSEFGEWVHTPEYGMVWMPYVIDEWRPFFHGHWSWTYDGWAWISYEPFGWLVFHYGYWYYEPYYGWFWMPGRIWSPARVHWYTYGNYCAWAPMPPPYHYWRHHPWDHDGGNVWITVNVNHFTNEYVGRHLIQRPFHGEKHHQGAWMKEPPRHRDVERVANRALPPVRISRERVDLRPDTPKVPTKYYRPKEIARKKMVLPEQDANKVREHRTTVEREVLVPRDKAPRRETQQRAPEQRQQQKQKEKQQQEQRQQKERQQKTIKRR